MILQNVPGKNSKNDSGLFHLNIPGRGGTPLISDPPTNRREQKFHPPPPERKKNHRNNFLYRNTQSQRD
jgi:hypothetical protein